MANDKHLHRLLSHPSDKLLLLQRVLQFDIIRLLLLCKVHNSRYSIQSTSFTLLSIGAAYNIRFQKCNIVDTIVRQDYRYQSQMSLDRVNLTRDVYGIPLLFLQCRLRADNDSVVCISVFWVGVRGEGILLLSEIRDLQSNDIAGWAAGYYPWWPAWWFRWTLIWTSMELWANDTVSRLPLRREGVGVEKWGYSVCWSS